MGCMPDKEISERSDINSSAFSKIGVQKKQTAENSVSMVSEGYSPSKIELQQCQSVQGRSQSIISIDLRARCEELVQKYNICSEFYSSHEIDMAYSHSLVLSVLLKQVRRQMQSSLIESPLTQQDLKEMQNLIQKIKKQLHDVQSYQNQINRGGWVQKSNRKGIKISTRRQQSTVGVLVNSIIDIPFETIVAILIEMDLYKLFIPFMEISRQEKIISRNCRIGYSLSKIPFLTKRQAFYQGIGYDRLRKKQSVFLFTRSLHNRPDLQKQLEYKAQINKKYVQLQYKYFVLKYKPLTRERGQITLAMNVDTKVDFVPIWLQDKISEDYGENFLMNLMKLSKNFKNSIWEQKVQANPNLFNFFKKRINQYFSEKRDEQDLANL